VEAGKQMKFMIITWLDEKVWLSLTEAEQQRVMSECAPHIEQLVSSGKFLSGAPLHPTTAATTVRLRDGKRLVTDGPFAETREQIGGYTLVDAKDRDEAIRIASGFLVPGTVSILEVRQVVELDNPALNPKARKTTSRRGIKLATIVLLTASLGAGARQAAASPSLCQFFSYYDAVSSTGAPLSFWERLAYSLAMTRASVTKPAVSRRASALRRAGNGDILSCDTTDRGRQNARFEAKLVDGRAALVTFAGGPGTFAERSGNHSFRRRSAF
jgi:hypothetical protein